MIIVVDDDFVNEKTLNERQAIGTPSPPAGTAKLLEELLARTYNNVNGIYSIGLRFFEVYGPWGTPGTILHDMAERAVSPGKTGSPILSLEEDFVMEGKDNIYIDDAIDALMAAMQF